MLRKMIVMGVVASLLMVASAQAATVNVTSVFNATESTGDAGWAGDHAWINNAGGTAVFDVYLTFDQAYTNVTAMEFLGTFKVDVADYFTQGGTGDVWDTVDFEWDGAGNLGNMNTLFAEGETEATSVSGTSKFVDFAAGNIVAGEQYLLGRMTVTALTEVPADQQWNLVFGFSQTFGSGFGIVADNVESVASLAQNPSNTTVAIPEPGTYAMLCGLGLVGAAIYRRRKNAR